LDDDTMHIIENKVENSGIPQGVFLKRHKVPLPGSPTENYLWKDLNLGMNLEVYTRVFRIIDCDEFTRKLFANEGVALNPAE
jgi:EF-hand domain-containing protein 1